MLSSIAKAGLEPGAPRQISLRTFYREANSEHLGEDHETPITQTVEQVEKQLERLNQEMLSQRLQMEEERVQFEALLKEKRLSFEIALKEERKEELERGFSEGFIKGEQSGLEAWQAKLSQANAITEKANEQREAYLDQSESTILKLAVQIASKIISETLSVHESAWISLVKNAIKEMRAFSPIKILVAPTDYDKTIRFLDDLVKSAHGSAILVFVDERLQMGDCKIESPAGILDAGVVTQLSQIEHALHQLLGMPQQ